MATPPKPDADGRWAVADLVAVRERVAKRLLETLHEEFPNLRFLWSAVTGPESGTNARELLENARMGWKPSS